jgi:hypothetical protein
MPTSGIRLTRDDEIIATDHAAVARELVGTGVWVAPVDLSSEPDETKSLLAKRVLTDAETAVLGQRFTLSREALLETIELAGRTPHVPGGGALDTYCIETETPYPAFRTLDPAMDFSAFVPFHVNRADDGTGTDEVGHVVSGDMKYRFRLPEGIYVLEMYCSAPDMGWRFTFDGSAPHGGLFDAVVPGTKVMVQAIGPERFHMRYVD